MFYWKFNLMLRFLFLFKVDSLFLERFFFIFIFKKNIRNIFFSFYFIKFEKMFGLSFYEIILILNILVEVYIF